MATHSIPISDDLWAELQAKSATEGKAIEELAEEALRRGLQDGEWQELLAYGAGRGRASGFAEEQAGEVVRVWRETLRGE
jgi:plasmid stability protein